MRSIITRLLALFSKERFDQDLDEEISIHLEMAAEENRRRGMSPEEARVAARIHFGGVEQVKGACREQRTLPALESFLQDIGFGFRSLRRHPRFYLVAIGTLALGIGSTTAVFSLVDHILFRALPYPQDNRLVSVGIVAPFESNEFMMSGGYAEWRRNQDLLAAVTSWSGIAECDLTEENPARFTCARIAWDFLPTLGIVPLTGRNLSEEDDQLGAPRVALISYRFWQNRFGGDPDAVGRSISLDGRLTEVIGILPRDFELPNLQKADLLVPQALPPEAYQPGGTRILRVFARLKPDVSLEQAQTALRRAFEESLDSIPPMYRKDVRFQVRSLRDRQIQDARASSWILLASVMAVLLIACANVSNLLLAWAANRRHELSMRAILGAGRRRLLRQAFLESLLLSLLGGTAGCGIAFLLLGMFRTIAPQGIPRLEQTTLDARVLLFTLCVSILAAILFGTIPALQSPHDAVLARSSGVGPSGKLFRKGLMAAQIAGSLMLVTAAGLLLQSLWNLYREPLGMESESVITVQIVLGEARYSGSGQAQHFFEELEVRLKRIPGVSALSVSDTIPPAGMMRARPLAGIRVDGREPFEEDTPGMVAWRSVTPGYFQVLGIPILKGRGFRDEDRETAANFIVLSEKLSRLLFPDETPIGRRIRLFRDRPWLEVIGIAQDVKNGGLESHPDPEYYLVRKHLPDFGLANQIPEGALRRATLGIRSPLSLEIVSNWIRAEIAGLDSTLPVTVETMKQRVNRLTEGTRFTASLLASFAGTALLLAAIGLYGLISFLVAERTPEIGLRMALGATTGQIRRLVLTSTLSWTTAGITLGIGGSVLVARAARALLFGVAEDDPLAVILATGLLLIVALLAAWLPADRAARLNPQRALRCN